jgi:hypothetical protein
MGAAVELLAGGAVPLAAAAGWLWLALAAGPRGAVPVRGRGRRR